jgi:predicted transcriptional regulator
MGGLTVRLPDSLHEKMRHLAEEEGISMNQLVMLAVSEKITRLDAEAQFAHLDALERFGVAVAEEENTQPDELMEDLLGRAGDEEPQEKDQPPAQME